MKILFLMRYYYPHIGGVERHVQEVSQSLSLKGHKVRIISEKDIKYPRIKFLGLLDIWFWLFKNRSLIEQSDIIHCHDVFIWYLPFRFLYLKKPVYTTFHGWEGVWPIPWKNILLKKIAARLSWRTIAVGKYIEKYYGIKTDVIIYGGTEKLKDLRTKKVKNYIVYVGRLEKDTGVLEFLNWVCVLVHGYKVDFVGDGALRKECEKYGRVHGFCDPKPFLAKAEICVPAGYLSYIQAKKFGCKIKVFAANPLKKDYWQEIQKILEFPTWGEIADAYLKLWKVKC